MRQAEGAADRQHGVADLQGVTTGEMGGFEIIPLDLHRRDVGHGVRPESDRPDFPAAVEADRDVVEFGPVDDVPVRDHHRPSGHQRDHAGAGLVFTRLAVLGPQRGLLGVDVDDRGPEELRQPSELGALSFERLGVARDLLVELLPLGVRQADRPHGIDPPATPGGGTFDGGKPHRRRRRILGTAGEREKQEGSQRRIEDTNAFHAAIDMHHGTLTLGP